MENKENKNARSLKNGNWYWIHKAIIQRYTHKVGSTGIAVYSFLASLADRNQSCFPSQKYIAQGLGYSRATISRTLKRLEAVGLIKINKRSRYHRVYHLLKVKVRCSIGETQMSHRRNSDVSPVHTNNNYITRNINNIVNEDKKSLNPYSFKGFKPKTREGLLALDIARELNDLKSLPVYLFYAKKYHESLLRKVLGEVKEVPIKKIKKSRVALFNCLIKKHAQRASKNNRD